MKNPTKCIKIGVGIRLMKVVDNATTGKSHGFDNGTSGTGNDYTYDANGNMTSDNNKGITSITYNHLNLPTEIYWGADKNIKYIYNASGQKIQKSVREGSEVKVVDYLDGFQYAGGVMQFFPHAEGYVKATPLSPTPTNTVFTYNYAFNYVDHLGNVRVSYTKDPLTGEIKILEENNYYPFGLKHPMYNTGKKDYKEDPGGGGGTVITHVNKIDYQYKYNGKEWQDELGLNMYDMDMRQYDPAIARWVVMDPVVHHSMSPYNAFDNNPVFWADPGGADAEAGNNSNDSTSSEGYDVRLAFGVKVSEVAAVGAVDSYYYGDSYESNDNSKKNGDPESRRAKMKEGASKLDTRKPVQLKEAYIVGFGRGSVGSMLKEVIKNSFKVDTGSWGIGPLDWITEQIESVLGNYEFYVDGDNHMLWGPQIAIQGNVEGVGLGFAYGENMVEDNISSSGSVGTIYRDEFSFSAGLFGMDYIDRRNCLGGPIVSSSRSSNIGPISKTTTNGKTSYSICNLPLTRYVQN